jgi:RNA polymerase sigma-70 factor (ECF subfamily)
MSELPTPPAGIDETWHRHRRRVLDVAYRMLGSVHDAEDIVQEAYSRLLAVDIESLDDVRGWLVTVTSRLCIDRLRSHERIKRAYVGPWLPEPIVGVASDDVDPADRVTLDDTVRMALMVVLEQLSPAERAAFVLHDVFGIDFHSVGELVGRSPQACRQLASRARRRIESDDAVARFHVDRSEHDRVVARFVDACERGDLESLLAVLDPGVIGDFDSGGVIPGAPLLALDGAPAVARQLMATVVNRSAAFSPADVNGEPGVIVSIGGQVVAVLSLGVRDGRIDVIHAIGNPAKLTHVTR